MMQMMKGVSLLVIQGSCLSRLSVTIQRSSCRRLNVPKMNQWTDPQSDTQRIEPVEDTLKFDVVAGDAKLLFQKIKHAEADLAKDLNLERMKDEFNRDIRPRLLPLCLILPAAFNSEQTAFLHGLTHKIIKRAPTYMSALDVMTPKEMVGREAFEDFVSYILARRVMVSEVWDQSFGDVESSVHDFAPDGLDFYRGESDASFIENSDRTKDGIAKLAFIIWKNRQVIHSEVIERVLCRTINDAEVLAALALQLKCLDLGVKKLKHFTDSAHAVSVMTGKHTIERNDPQRGKNMHGKYMLLRHLKKKFETVIIAQKPRRLLFMADALLRFDGVPKADDVEKILENCRRQLGGAPIFYVYQNKAARQIINTFGDKAKEYKHEIDTVYYLTVEKERKFNVLMQLVNTLSPNCLYLIIDKFEEQPPEFVDSIYSFLPDRMLPLKEGTTSIFSMNANDDISFEQKKEDGVEGIGDLSEDPFTKETGKPNERKLIVVFGAALLSRHDFIQEDACTIILTESHELDAVKSAGIKEISTATYVQFHGVHTLRKEENLGKTREDRRRRTKDKWRKR